MTLIEAVVLGLIQGATEFLPISSSGHLLLVPQLLSMPAPNLALIAIVHEGTLLAVLFYFRHDLWRIARAVIIGLRLGSPAGSDDARLGWHILVGSIPAAAAGLLLEGPLEEIFGSPSKAALLLIGTAALLVAGERALTGRKSVEHMSWMDAIIIGLFQMLALLPGISRSGSTISAALWRGLDRPAAARYSFLLGVPAILGAGLLALLDILAATDLADIWPALLTAFLSASVTGYLCIRLLLNWLRRRTLYVFAVYCAAFGIIYLAAYASN